MALSSRGAPLQSARSALSGCCQAEDEVSSSDPGDGHLLAVTSLGNQGALNNKARALSRRGGSSQIQGPSDGPKPLLHNRLRPGGLCAPVLHILGRHGIPQDRPPWF